MHSSRSVITSHSSNYIPCRKVCSTHWLAKVVWYKSKEKNPVPGGDQTSLATAVIMLYIILYYTLIFSESETMKKAHVLQATTLISSMPHIVLIPVTAFYLSD
jgi:hypothetical protein